MALLNSRLLLAAELLGEVETVCDIGTDHALLPIYLVKNKQAKRVVACDIAKGPLAKAKENVLKNGVADKISLRLANGLDGVKPNECEAVIIAGMGGETIAEIISRAPWLKTAKQTLVLQPMTADDRLREFLVHEGFEILTEKCTFSAGRVYTVIKAKFSGEDITVSKDFYYIGKILDQENVTMEAEIAFVKKHLKSMKKCLKDIEGVERRKDLYERISGALPLIEEKLKKFI